MSAQYNIEVGSYKFLSLDPPSGWVRNAYWSCDEGLTLTESSEVGAVVNVTHYFSGAAYVNVSYTYEYYGSFDHNMHAGRSSKTYRITCTGGTASISEENIELNPGESHTLKCKRSKSYGTPVWTSSNKNVVTVDNNGKIKAVATGVATVKWDPITAEPCYCEVRVRKINAKSITLTPNPLNVVVGKGKTLKPAFSPSGSSATLAWASDNENIATVSSSGYVKGILEGKTTITAKSETGVTAKVTVEVISAPTAVFLPSEVVLSAGYYYTLKPTLTPANSEAVYKWNSSDTSVATVTSNGKIYGKKEGTAIITVTTDNNISTSTSVRIVRASSEIDNATTTYRVRTITNLMNKIAK